LIPHTAATERGRGPSGPWAQRTRAGDNRSRRTYAVQSAHVL